MSGNEQAGISPAIVYVERIQPSEYVVYRPGTFEVSGTFPTSDDATAYARTEWSDLVVAVVHEYPIFQGAPYVEAA
jgi:hypothetical protein